MTPNALFENVSVGKTIAAAWVFTVSVFFLYSIFFPFLQSEKITAATQVGYNNGYAAAANQAMASFSGNALQNGYNNGYGTAILQLAQALSAQYEGGCQEPVPVTIGSGSVGIVSVDCLQRAAQSASSGQTAPVTPAQ